MEGLAVKHSIVMFIFVIVMLFSPAENLKHGIAEAPAPQAHPPNHSNLPTCCAKCLCVPPGYYGNKQFCPCYNNWKTKRGGPKCP
ncbi:hypothetical protein V2J09_012331 [Rumex salicifolius]